MDEGQRQTGRRIQIILGCACQDMESRVSADRASGKWPEASGKCQRQRQPAEPQSQLRVSVRARNYTQYVER